MISEKYSRFINEDASEVASELAYFDKTISNAIGKQSWEKEFNDKNVKFEVVEWSSGNDTRIKFAKTDDMIEYLRTKCQSILENSYKAFKATDYTSQIKWGYDLEKLYDGDFIAKNNWFSHSFDVVATLDNYSPVLDFFGIKEYSDVTIFTIDVLATGEIEFKPNKSMPSAMFKR